MAYIGKTHLTFIFKADAANVAEGDRLFKSHNEWIQKTHHRDGENPGDGGVKKWPISS